MLATRRIRDCGAVGNIDFVTAINLMAVKLTVIKLVAECANRIKAGIEIPAFYMRNRQSHKRAKLKPAIEISAATYRRKIIFVKQNT